LGADVVGRREHRCQGRRRLDAAACTKNLAIVSALLSAGADVNAKDDNGLTALTYARSHGQSNEVIEMLLAAGAKD
jgi:ankyrin repeat protein